MHIRQEDLEQFPNNTSNTEDMIAFLEHLDNCDYCLEQFIHEEEAHTISTPAYLKEQILNRAASPDVLVAKTAAATSVKMQLFYHSLQTAAGVVLALLLLFSIGRIDFSSLHSRAYANEMQTQTTAPKPRKNYLNEFSRNTSEELTNSTRIFTNYLNEFSNKISHGGNIK